MESENLCKDTMIKNVRILSVCTSDTYGGAAKAAYRIHQGVCSLGVDCKMFVKDKGSQDTSVHSLSEFVPHNSLYKVLDWCAAKVKNQIQHYYWNQYPNKDANYKSDMRGTALHGALKKLDYDVLHLHWINQRFISLEDLPKDKPIVWTLHDSWPFCGVCHYFLDCEGYQHQCGNCPQLCSSNPDDLSHDVWKSKADIYENLDLHIVTPSHWLADCARQSALFKNRDIWVIPNCLDTDLFRPLSMNEVHLVADRQQNAVVRRVLREATKEKGFANPFILYGAMQAATDRIKGFANLLSAFQILDEQCFKAQLVVFGANPQDLPMQFEHIDVTFVGYIYDSAVLTALYNLADVMVVPSLTENLSCVIMESLSSGTPVVAFNIGGNSDMIDHKQNGYLAKEKDGEDLAKGVQWCIENNINNELGQNARKKVLQNYTPEIVCEKYKKLYKSLV